MAFEYAPEKGVARKPPHTRPVRRAWHEIPPGLFYLPIAIGVFWKMIRHRSARAPLAANWALPGGGLHPLSKAWFSSLFPEGSELAPACRKVAAMTAADTLSGMVEDFGGGSPYPVVLKPDAGVQGRQVCIARDRETLLAFWQREGGGRGPYKGDWILQAYVPGFEVSVFYMRTDPQRPGRLVAMTRKQGFKVTGNGADTIAELIEKADADDATKRLILRRTPADTARVPSEAEEVELVPVRNHNAGATFHDISREITSALEEALCPVLASIEGYCHGRLDIRAPDYASLLAGKGIRVLEANTLYSEPVHAYDPRYSLVDAYRIFMDCWEHAFRTGLANMRAGRKPPPFWKSVLNRSQHN